MVRYLGDLVREARESRGLTQAHCGQLTGYSRQAVADFESGRRTQNVFDYCIGLSKAFADRSLYARAVSIHTGVLVVIRDYAVNEHREFEETLALIDLGPSADGQTQRRHVALVYKELREAIEAEQHLLNSLRESYGLNESDLEAVTA